MYVLGAYLHCLHTNDSGQMGSNRSASEIKDQHLGTEPKGMEREKAEKPPAVLSMDAAALVAGNRTCLKLFKAGRSGSRNGFLLQFWLY